MDDFHQLLLRALENAGCFTRTLQVDPDGESGLLRVTAPDDSLHSVHFYNPDK